MITGKGATGVRAEEGTPGMIQSCFDQNRKSLSWRDPALANLIAGKKVSLPPFPSSVGLPTSRIRGENGDIVLLHSDQDPAKEAAESFQVKRPDAVLLLGFGFGYVALEAVRRLPSWMWLTVIEPDPDLFRSAMEFVDLTPLFSRDRVKFLVGLERAELQESLRIWCNEAQADDMSLLSHLPLERARPSIYRQALADVKEALNYRSSEVVTLLKHAKQITRNSLGNIPFMVGSQGVNVFENRFRGVPGIVVAAGPSLERQVEALRKVKDRAIIVCVGKSLRFLLENGIEPHFAAHLDLVPESEVVFQGYDIPESCTLVWDPESNTQAVSRFTGDRITFETGTEWETWAKTFWGEKGYLQRGLSVAHTAFHFIRTLGVDPIALVGVDLAFPGNRTHAEGVTMTWGGGLESIEKVMRDVPSVTGGTVRTIPSFHAMVTLFETEIAKTDGRVINTSDVGALIRGAETATLESIVGEPIDVRDRIASLMAHPRKFDRDAFQSFSDRLTATVERVTGVTETGLRMIKRVRRLDLKNRNDREELVRLGKKINGCKSELEKEGEFQRVLHRYFSPLAVRVKKLVREKELCPPDDLEGRTRLDSDRLTAYFEEFQRGARFLRETLFPVTSELLG